MASQAAGHMGVIQGSCQKPFSALVDLGLGLRCASEKLPGDAGAVGPGTTFWAVRV